MGKDKIVYSCKECGFNSAKWLGKCPECNSWNSFIEEQVVQKNTPFQADISSSATGEIESFAQILTKNNTSKVNRSWPFSTSLLTNFFGSDGLVSSSLTLMAGEPGIGKSTFALQILRSLYNGSGKNPPKLIYITAEESKTELALRAKRLDIPQEIFCYQANNYEKIEKVILTQKPDIVIIDSIQTIFSTNISSNPGSVSQVSTLTNMFLALGKSNGLAIILIGHVTKEGQIAGPKTLEHMVDSVLILENNDNTSFRTLSFSKHRFGSVDNLLLLKMESTGLTIITDPSLVLLENIENGIGICYGVGIAKNLPLMVEVQALVNSKPYKPNSDEDNSGEKFSFGRREAIGIKIGKLNIVLAIMEKYLGLNLKSKDIYVQLQGLPKNVEDDSLDLPIMLSILSSIYNKPISEINVQAVLKKGITFDDDCFQVNSFQVNKNSGNVLRQSFAGRLTLSGKLRKATSHVLRQKTSTNLGFSFN